MYAVTADAKDLGPFNGTKAAPGLLVIQPDEFGQKGKILAQTGATAARPDLAATLTKALAIHHKSDKAFSTHVRKGQQAGVFWETALPVTDPQEKQARERGRRP